MKPLPALRHSPPRVLPGAAHGAELLAPIAGLRRHPFSRRRRSLHRCWPRMGGSTARNGLASEVARYRARTGGGLRLISVESKVAQRPKDQPAVSQLIGASLARSRYHRFFYQVIFRSKGEGQGAVLLGASSASELDRLGAHLLTDPDSVCGDRAVHCTAFPEACTVSLEMEIVLNGASHTVAWGSLLASVAVRPRRVELLRAYAGRLVPVKIDPADPHALRLQL